MTDYWEEEAEVAERCLEQNWNSLMNYPFEVFHFEDFTDRLDCIAENIEYYANRADWIRSCFLRGNSK